MTRNDTQTKRRNQRRQPGHQTATDSEVNKIVGYGEPQTIILIHIPTGETYSGATGRNRGCPGTRVPDVCNINTYTADTLK